MTKTVYVPQGNCARFIHDITSKYDIDGLYTDDFSTCSILVCISKDFSRMILAHLDTHVTFDQLKEDIDYVGEFESIVIISRDQGKYVKDNWVRFIEEKLRYKVYQLEITNDIQGIYISPTSNNFKILDVKVPNIKTCTRNNLELIHHPQEQQILAVRHIGDIVGKRAMMKLGGTPIDQKKQYLIFDGQAWQPLSEKETEVNDNHTLTKQEMRVLTPQKSYVALASELNAIGRSFNQHLKTVNSLEDVVLITTSYLEEYLHNYNHPYLFKRNLKERINFENNVPQTLEDKSFKAKLNLTLNREEDSFLEIQDLFNSYIKNAPDTEYKTRNMEYNTLFSDAYLRRKYYYDLKQNYKEIENQATTLNEQAVEGYKNNKFQSAADLFFKAIQLYTCCSLKNDPKLATLYYNCGKSFQQLSKYEEAKFFLNTSLILRENYIEPRPRAEIEKTKKAIDECKRAQEQPSTTWVESSSNRASSNSQGLGK
ncbi:hypothetical protein NF27_JN00020 [Candidatus Jidaibacter acanthamoeba]|uniref:Tetratricopeptide repeat protein n=1 Tax=Candidatus Jidaibacter acanthamoebae TaxID=86105 RepID=A0A0C1MW46_9RICK|nr:hypothetical protein [Candidatus Jidaibacter acanthamoeba]KIE04096.1 hypothetical protein NF27_JN00020 [Candidatus Jidaibacter acanthamoeba]